MADTNIHRRRPHHLHVPDGSSMDTPSNSLSAKQQQAKQQRKRKRRGVKRSKSNDHDQDFHNNNEPPFIVLFIQVVLTMVLILSVVLLVFHHFFPTTSLLSEAEDPGSGSANRLLYDDDDGGGGGSGGSGGESANGQVQPPLLQQNQPLIQYSAENEAHLAVLAKQMNQNDDKSKPSDANNNHHSIVVNQNTTTTTTTTQVVPEPPPPQPKTHPPYPSFLLSNVSQWDAFSLAQAAENTTTSTTTTAANNKTTTTTNSTSITTNTTNNNTITTSSSFAPFWQQAQQLRQRFVDTYGTESISRMLLDRGLTTYYHHSDQKQGMESTSSSSPSSLIATACRFQQAHQQQRPFRFAFGGYSVTVGRGNYFHQSYPFQMERLLEPLVTLAGLSSLEVRNAAIGACPAFPYGWCLTEFLGMEPDVISWDFSMNEAGGVPEGLEAYIRQVLAKFGTSSSTRGGVPPKLLVKDTYLATARRELLERYIPWLLDPLVMHTGPAVEPMLDRPEAQRPPGFQQWRVFGAPPGAPGQALHHPALKEHELMGWLLAMHFLAAMEYWVTLRQDNPSWQCPLAEFAAVDDNDKSRRSLSVRRRLPPPQSPLLAATSSTKAAPISTVTKTVNGTTTTTNATQVEATAVEMEWDTSLFGQRIPGAAASNDTVHYYDDTSFIMNPMHCRTTFQPALEEGDLSAWIVRGTTAEDLDPHLPKTLLNYFQGWTLDLSADEKAAERRLATYPDRLGYIDSKEAYYGLYSSPRMELFLPIPQSMTTDTTNSDRAPPVMGQPARDWFVSIILCQVPEKRDVDACHMQTDLGVLVDGIAMANHSSMMSATGTQFLGKNLCLRVPIPEQANLTSHNQLLLEGMGNATTTISTTTMTQSSNTTVNVTTDTTTANTTTTTTTSFSAETIPGWLNPDPIGLLVDIFVTNPHLVHMNQACSISHVIWEERVLP